MNHVASLLGTSRKKVCRDWKKFMLCVTTFVIIILITHSIIFYTAPTKAEVESFLKVNGCNPDATETDHDSEYQCAHYLRRHTTVKFGQLGLKINADLTTYAYTPFGYFYYDPTPIDPAEFGCALRGSCKNDEHAYVFVITRDEGPVVYNPVNGNYIGKPADLLREMGCEVQPYKKQLFSIYPQNIELAQKYSRCTFSLHEQLFDIVGNKNQEEKPVSAVCSANSYNCADFNTQSEAQAVFNACPTDVHYLDGDKDGMACETLP